MAIARWILFVVVCAGHARADQAAQTPPPAAVEHYNAGDAAYSAGDFKKAIEEFRTAYSIHPAPLLLFNIAQAYRLDGQPEKALFIYRQYVAKDAQGVKRHDAEEKIRELQDLLTRQRESKEKPPVGTANPADEPPGPASAPPKEPPKPAAPPAATQSPPSSAPAHEGVRLRPIGIGLAAAGGALLIIGTGVAGAAPGVNEQGASSVTLPDQRQYHDRAVTMNAAGWSLVGIGAATAAVGIILAALPRRERARTAWLKGSSVGLEAHW